jgi:CubicO group peptidase (beta-lactamase class C family)
MTMADLLHWASGLDWQEDYEYAPLKSSVVAMLYTRGHRDMAAFTVDQDAYAAPGQVFRYSSGDSGLLSAALKGIVGPARYADYPWTALFEPWAFAMPSGKPTPRVSSSPRPTPTSPRGIWRGSAC